jgi:hypothetical protein
MLKKFAINEFAIRKIGHHYYGSGPNSWERPVMNSVEEVILVHEYHPTSDSTTCVRTAEEDLNMIRHSRIDWKAPVITQAALLDILKKDKKDAAKKKRSKTMEKTFVGNPDKSNSSVERRVIEWEEVIQRSTACRLDMFNSSMERQLPDMNDRIEEMQRSKARNLDGFNSSIEGQLSVMKDRIKEMRRLGALRRLVIGYGSCASKES